MGVYKWRYQCESMTGYTFTPPGRRDQWLLVSVLRHKKCRVNEIAEVLKRQGVSNSGLLDQQSGAQTTRPTQPTKGC